MSAQPPGRIHLTNATVDLVRRRVLREGRELVLTRLEADLLAYLIARPGHDVPREQLLAEVWGYAPTSTSRAVDFAVRRLRNKLGEPRSPIHILTAHGVGYRYAPPGVGTPVVLPVGTRPGLQLATGVLDLDRRTFRRSGDDPEAISRLEGAMLELLVSPLGRIVTREELIRAVWGRGDHGGSLDAAVRRLRVKVEPDPSNPQTLVTVRGEGLRIEVAPSTACQARRTNLTPADTSFIERPDTQALLDALSNPVVTLVGTAGMGKTRLAREVGGLLLALDPNRQVWFCDLSAALSEHGIVRGVEAAMGIERASVGDPVARIGRVLARRPAGTVLILDNFEQVKAHASTLETWLAAAPAVRWIVTSRETLGLAAEHGMRLQRLSVPAAAALFVDRAQGDAVSVDDPVVHALVGRLDCLPLAIELAAARSDQYGPADLLERLDRRLDLLIRRAPGSESQHSTLRGALDWSWDLLSEEERSALARASVFEGPFPPARAQAVIAVFDATDALRALCARSLMHLNGEGTFRMDEGIRDYAREKLLILGDQPATRERYEQVHLARGEACVAGMRSPRCLKALAELRTLRADLLSVHHRATEARVSARSALVLDVLLGLDCSPALRQVVIEQALAMQPPPELAWQLLRIRGDAQRVAGSLDEALHSLTQAHEIAQTVGPHAAARAARLLAIACRLAGRTAQARSLLEGALEVFRAEPDPVRVGRTLANLGLVAHDGGRYDEAETLLRDAVAALRRVGDLTVLQSVLNNLGALLEMRGDLEGALVALEGAGDLARQLGDRVRELGTLERVARMRRVQNDPSGSEEMLGAAQVGYGALGMAHFERAVRVNRGALALERGDLDLARELLSLAVDETSNSLREHTVAFGNLAILRHMEGEFDEAEGLFRDLIGPLEAAESRHMLAMVLAHHGMVLADLDRVDAAEDALTRAAEVADVDMPGLAVFLQVCVGVLDCARARREPKGGAAFVLAARGAAETALQPAAEGADLSVAERHQEVHLALSLLEQSLERTDGAG